MDSDRSNQSTGRSRVQKMSSEHLRVSSWLRELMLFFALATSTMQFFAIVILLPMQSMAEHSSITGFEMGTIIAS